MKTYSSFGKKEKEKKKSRERGKKEIICVDYAHRNIVYMCHAPAVPLPHTMIL